MTADNVPASPRDAALLYLATADLPAAAFRAGVRLLLAASAENGYVRRQSADVRRMLGNISESQMRRVLGQLQAVDAIHYTTNGDVHVYFRSWSTNTPDPSKSHSRAKNAHPCADYAHPCAENAQTDKAACAENAHPCADYAHPCAENAHLLTRAHARAQSVSKYSDLDLHNDHTDLLTPTPNPETAVAAGLLIDAGMDRGFATSLAARFPLERIRRAVGWWWDDQQSDNPHFKRRPAIVVNWLQEGKGLPPLSEAFENSELYRSHRTPAELAAGDGMSAQQRRLRSRYAPDEYADIILG